MPYPIAHTAIFIIFFFSVAIYNFIIAYKNERVTKKDVLFLIILFGIGGFFSLFPDVSAVINTLLYGSRGDHCSLGPIPTHSIAFASIALLVGTPIGYIMYKNLNSAISVGLFAESCSLFHLLIDDIDNGVISYLYPIYDASFSLFPLITKKVELNLIDYGITFIGIICIIFCIILSAISLNKLKFGSK